MIARLGQPERVADVPKDVLEDASALMKEMVEEAIDAMKISAEPV